MAPEHHDPRTPRPPGAPGRSDVAAGADAPVAADQTLADRDQTLADLDETVSDSDQAAAGKDQAAAEGDQRASDQDQASAKPLAYSRLSTSRPGDGAPARIDAQSRAAGRATSCPQLAAPAGDARRRSRVQDALAAGRLTIRSERHNGTHVVAVVGELDVSTAQRVEDELRTVEATDVEQVIVDVAGLTFVDSSGVHLIARADARCRTTAKRLVVRPGRPQIQRVFALAGADSLPFAA